MSGRRISVALRLSILASVAGWWLSGSRVVWADIYVYRDARGIMHFTNVPTKPVYRPFQLLQPYVRSLGGKESAAFDQLIRESCQRHRVEFALVKAVIKAESAFDPLALSRAGAHGLMQLMPDTAALHGVTDIRDPRDNIDGGVRHLRRLLDRFGGNLTLTLAAYNAGPEAVARYNGVPPYEETQEYVQRVLQYRESYRQHSLRTDPVGWATLSG
ncbi:MAG: lytic transglycosylase domain-containing protein [Deltaproteobacteria bacterium]|nr:lytic transglycosylase domain-containing protein [Deltaproteobacteria bacterium]